MGAGLPRWPRMLARQGLTLADFDFYEIHEAFASTVLATLAALGGQRAYLHGATGVWTRPLGSIDRSRLNVAGSSLAAGHPFAATGGRIVAHAGQAPRREGLRARPWSRSAPAGGQGASWRSWRRA